MIRPIAISLSPNSEAEDILAAFKMFFSPWSYKTGKHLFTLSEWFKDYFGVKYAIPFNSGRAALYTILKYLNLQNDDEVVLQAFTCVAVPNAVIWAGAKPVYVDITDTMTIDPTDLEKKITNKTKAIVIQYTFGIPGEIDEIVRIAKKHRLFIVEDVAHTIGTVYKGKKLGSIGDAAFFSFGRDKAFSSVFGGIAITNNKAVGEFIISSEKNLSHPSSSWIMQQLFHPIAFSIILPTYNFFSLGKLLLVFFQKIHFLSFPVSQAEKKSKKESLYIKKLPNALAYLILLQLKKIDKYNNKRKEIVQYFTESLANTSYKIPYKRITPLLRFPIFTKKQDHLIEQFKKHHIYLGDWYKRVIDPKGVSFKNIFYSPSLCPKSETIAKEVINLPAYPTMSLADAQQIVSLLKQYA